MLRLQILENTKDDQFQKKIIILFIFSKNNHITKEFFHEIKNLKSNLEIGEAE